MRDRHLRPELWDFFPTYTHTCAKCKAELFHEDNYIHDRYHYLWTKLINETHIEICEGDRYKTMVAIEQIWKDNITRPQQKRYNEQT